MAGKQLKEKEIFTKHYASLCNTLTDINHLLPYFVQESVISVSDEEEIDACKTIRAKVKKLLSHISGPLKAENENTTGFYKMLTIMADHGNHGTKDLAEKMSSKLTSSSSKVQHEVVNEEKPVISDIDHHHHTSSSVASSTVRTADPFSAQFSTLVAAVEALLMQCHNHDKLEQCAQFCSNLTISDNSDKLLFNDEQLQKIISCKTFHELFMILRKHWSWQDYSILTHIIDISGLKEAKDELELFETRMAAYQGMKVISENIPSESIPPDYIRLKILIKKPYRGLTVEKYTELRDFVFKYLDINRYIALPFIEFLYSSLQLQWYVLKKAVPHMIKMAQQNETIFTSNSVVLIHVGQCIVFDYRAKDSKQMDQVDRNVERKIISSEREEKCHKFPPAKPINIGANDDPQDEFDKSNKINELQNDEKSDERTLVEPQKAICSAPNEKEFSIASKEYSEKFDKPNATTLFNQFYVKVLITTAVAMFIIAVIIPLLFLESPYTHKSHDDQQKKINVLVQSVMQEIPQFAAMRMEEVVEHNNTMYSKQNIGLLASDKANVQVNSLQEKGDYTQLQTNLYQEMNMLTTDQYDQLNNFVKSLLMNESSEVAPVILRNFTKKELEIEEYYSNPFFAFEEGYQMCLKVDKNGYADGEGTHISVFLYLMKGPYDDKLEQSGHWPLRGTFKIELLNQLNDVTHIVKFHHHQCSGKCTDRVVEGVMANAGYGKTKFFSHDLLRHSEFLTFRVWYEDTEPPYQVAPVTFKVTQFSQWLKSNEEWGSSPFFTFDGGYQMHLVIRPADKCEGTHVSVYLGLMKGPHDDKLEQSGHWPLRGTFTIELLNQLNDSNHYSRQVQLHHHECSECTDRVLEGEIAYQGHGHAQFISHDALLHYNNNSYYINDSLIFKISYEHMEPLYQVAPVIFKVTKFSQWLNSKENWFSSPFFAFSEGYQLCMQVYADGYGDGEGTHVSVFLHLMKGPHDDKLEQSGRWPLRGTFTIELLNQLNDSDHYGHIVLFHDYLCSEYSNRIFEDMASMGCGYSQFISHDTLLYNNSSYYRNDFLIFRISYEHVESSYQVIPVAFKLRNFSQLLKNKDEWYSSPFFAFSQGYQMCLNVFAAGHGNGESTHVSVYLYLMKGPHDDKLEQSGHWPLRGTFTIKLLNQLNDGDHYSRMVQFHHNWCSECTNRVLRGAMANSGCGEPYFISHDILRDSNYYKHDSIIFRISYENTEPPYQIAPVTFKFTQFSLWLRNKDVWYSSPFFAFVEGYQMSLKVYAVADSKGTDLSVNLHLTKGVYDDKLEQSGHWPLRGTFTIELLNQLNDSDHFHRIVQFHHHICSECTNRVLEKVMAHSGRGFSHFMSYYTLLYHGYYRNDSLIFRISYEHIEPPNQVAPVIFKLGKFSQWLKATTNWFSSPIIAFKEGYQLCLKVNAVGFGAGVIYVSVFLHLMKGPYDDKLEQSGHWPLRGTFTIELLNQLNDSYHYSRLVQFHHHICSECTNRVLEEEMASSGRGFSRLMSYDTLVYHGYCRNDSLVFRISYEHMEPPNQVTPVIFKINKFSYWLINSEEWDSSPFIAFEEGYQICLKVYTADFQVSKGIYVSVYLHLMKGPHDDKLEQSGHWPLRGTFTIELLNQMNDSDHYSCIVQFHHYWCSVCTNRVLEEIMAYIGRGKPHFIPFDILLHHGYYRNDSVIFRISYEHMEPPNQVAPVIFKLSKFSQWLKAKEEWDSSPFIAFKEGYQMYLKVYAAGYGDGEDTHISVFLYLMKGPFDDKLEQSGHWPLRGTFTIELLNQLNDSDHYSRMMQFHHNWCSECTNRVLRGAMANSGKGQPRFISHETFLHNDNSYYRYDSLMLKISYQGMEAPNQIAPVTYKLSNFTQWLKSKDLWLSSPFFAFTEGYQMFLSITNAGNDGGTHVSVFLYLMKGPYDDKLEQSGHWPMRGIFTIELLNQLNDSDHYSPAVMYIPSSSGKRMYGNEKDVVEFAAEFISHETLFKNKGYLEDDILYFRISYFTNYNGIKGHFIIINLNNGYSYMYF